MDIARPNAAKDKRKKRIIYGVITAVVLIGITIGLSRLKPAAPTVPKDIVWMDVVKRGPMVRQVRGLGTLVPEEIRWIAARTQGRVDKIILRPGAVVEPGSLILELTNPDVVSNAANAESALRAAEAQLANIRVQLESQLLAAEAAAARDGIAFELEGLGELLAVDGQDVAVHAGGEDGRKALRATARTARGRFAALTAARATLLAAGLRAGRCGRLSAGLSGRRCARGGLGAFTRR